MAVAGHRPSSPSDLEMPSAAAGQPPGGQHSCAAAVADGTPGTTQLGHDLHDTPVATCDVCATSLRRRQSLIREASFREPEFVQPQQPPWWWGGRCGTLHARLAAHLEARTTHIIVIALVILDLTIVVTELILSSIYCHGSKPHAVERAEEALSWTSVAILFIFVVELVVKLAVFGPSYFLGSWVQLLDATVVVASLTLELALKGVASEAVALLVFFRLWRVVRIMHSLMEALELNHEEVTKQHHAQVAQLQKDLAASQRRVAQLVQQLGQSNPAGATQDGAVLINVGSPSRTFLHRR